MIGLARTVVAAVLAVLGAHALAYVLLQILPDASVAALGLHAAQEQAVQAFRSARALDSYPVILGNLVQGDLGKTLDNVPVEHALLQALAETGPRMLIAIILSAMAAIVYAVLSRTFWPQWARVSSALAFLPAFVIPVFLYAFYLSLNLTNTQHLRWLMLEAFCIVSIAFTPAALLLFQTHNSMKRLDASAHALRYRAMGAAEWRVRLRLLRNLAYELMPTLEKLITMMITLSIFAELLLNVHGIGALTARAISRSDWALILGLVLLFATLINSARIVSETTRLWLGRHRRGVS